MKAEGREATLSGFLEEIALIADIDTVDPAQDYVLLMTCTAQRAWNSPMFTLPVWKMECSRAVCVFFRMILQIWKKSADSVMWVLRGR